MYRPRPVPPRRRSRQNRVKICADQSRSGRPSPWSLDGHRDAAAARARARSVISAAAVALRVLEQVAEHLVDLVRVDPDLVDRSPAVSMRERSAASAARGDPAVDVAPAGRPRQVDRPAGSSSRRPASIRAMSSSSVISRASRSASASTVAEHLLALLVVEPVPALTSRVAVKPFTPVSGLRSSWATVATRSARLPVPALAGRAAAQRHHDAGPPGRAGRRAGSGQETSSSRPPTRRQRRSGCPVRMARPPYGSQTLPPVPVAAVGQRQHVR